MSIREIREFLVEEGERRRRLGRSALQSQLDDWSSHLDRSKVSDEEPKALEEG